MENQTPKTHPMIIVAATTMTIASLVAIASFAGWIPSRNSAETPPAPAAQTAVTPPVPTVITPDVPAAAVQAVPVEPPAPPQKAVSAHKVAPKKVTKEVDYTYESYESTPNHNNRGATPVGNYPMNDNGVYVEGSRQQTQQQQYAPTCRDCATVESVREIKHEGESTGLGAIGGGVLGGLLGNQVGGGRGKTVGAVVGAVGGAYTGNAVEKNVRSTKNYEITVRLDDGNTRVFNEAQPPALQRGDRVRIRNGQLNRL